MSSNQQTGLIRPPKDKTYSIYVFLCNKSAKLLDQTPDWFSCINMMCGKLANHTNSEIFEFIKMTSPQNLTAIIYDRKGKVLSIGKNSYVKTHPLQAQHAGKVGLYYKIFLHAEIDAIVKCRALEKAYRISVIRVGKNGDLLLAKPCEICLSAISHTPIKIIEHS